MPCCWDRTAIIHCHYLPLLLGLNEAKGNAYSFANIDVKMDAYNYFHTILINLNSECEFSDCQ